MRCIAKYHLTRKTLGHTILIIIVMCSLFALSKLQGYAEYSQDVQYQIEIDESYQQALIRFQFAEKDGILSLQVNEVDIDMEYPQIEIYENGIYSITYTKKTEDSVLEEKKFTIEVQDLQNNQQEALQHEKLGNDLVPDLNLYNYLIDIHGLPANFSKDDLLLVPYLQYGNSDEGKRIQSLEGIQYMQNLEFILLNDQHITSIEVMKQGYYPKMTYMEFNNWHDYGQNQIKDFSVLTSTRFPVLKDQIMFNNNQIGDQEINTLPTKDYIINGRFYFEHNNISNPTVFLAYEQIKELDLHMNKIETVDAFINLKNFEQLKLSNNKIKDISPLQYLQTNANSKIWLGNNQISDLSSLQNKDGFVFASTYVNDTEWFKDPLNDSGQQVMEEPLYVNPKDGKIQIQRSVKNRDGELLDIVVDGIAYEVYETKIDATVQYFSYQIEYYDAVTHYLVHVTYPIIWHSNPTITAEDAYIFENEKFDILEGVSAVDENGNPLTAQVIDTGGFDSSIPGLYEITYQCIDSLGYKETMKRNIYVNGIPKEKDVQLRYRVNTQQIEDKIKEELSYSFMEVKDNGEIAQKEIAKKDIEIRSSTDIDTLAKTSGLHSIDVDVSVRGRVWTTSLVILVLDDNSIQTTDASLIIYAQNIQLNTIQASTISKEELLKYGNVKGYIYNKETHKYEDVTQSINIVENNVQDIRKSKNGGIYNLSYVLTSANTEVSKKVLVIVEGNDVNTEDDTLYHYAISKQDVTLTYAEASTISKEKLLSKLSSKGYEITTNKELMLDIPKNDMDSIHNISKSGGNVSIVIEGYDAMQNKVIETSAVVEILSSNTTNESKQEKDKQQDDKKSQNVKTADTTNITSLIILLMASVMMWIGLYHYYHTIRHRLN